MSRMRRFLMLALVYVSFTALSFAQQRPNWASYPVPTCDRPGGCFYEWVPGEWWYGQWDAETGQVLFSGPLDTKNNFERLNPKGSKDLMHSIDADVEFWYCEEGVDACLYDPDAPFLVGTGHMHASITLIYDDVHGEWLNGCPAVWYSRGKVYDEAGTAFDVTTSWLALPTMSEPDPIMCTEDGEFCLPCRWKKFGIEISPSK